MQTRIPEGYKSLLSIYDTQKAISLLKRLFEDRLGALLNLYRVSAPLFVEEHSGLNDNLNGYERPVSFDILRSEHKAQVVQSLAKWKRVALKRYGFYPGKGLYTDMNAIRRDEDELDVCGSVGLGEGHPLGKPESRLPEAHGHGHRDRHLRHAGHHAGHLSPATKAGEA